MKILAIRIEPHDRPCVVFDLDGKARAYRYTFAFLIQENP